MSNRSDLETVGLITSERNLAGKVRLLDYDKADLIFFAVLLCLGLWLFLPGLTPGKMLLPFPDNIYSKPDSGLEVPYNKAYIPGSDVVLQYQPWNDYMCERLKAGEIPFWDPYNFCGYPFFANCLQQMTYIPRLIISILFPSEMVLTALILLHFFLGGIGIYYLLKAYGVSPLAAGVTSILFLFKFTHAPVMLMIPVGFVVAYMPISLLLMVKIMRGGRWSYALLFAICASCLASSSYPVLVVHLMYLATAIIIFEYIIAKQSGAGKPGTGVLRVILGFVFGIMFSLTQLLPMLEFYPLSARHWLLGHDFNLIRLYPTHIRFMTFQRLLFPPQMVNFPFDLPLEVTTLYLSIIPVLILLPFYGQWKDKTYRFFLIAAVVAGLLTFPVTVSHLAYKYLPGFGITPMPPELIMFFCLLVAFGLSFDHLIKTRQIFSPARVAVFSIAVLLFSVVPLLEAVLKNKTDMFAPNYVVFIASVAVFIAALFWRVKKGDGRIFAAIVTIIICLNILPLMKREMRFYGPEGSWGVECDTLKSQTETGETGYGSPRYFCATGMAYFSPNMNIYPGVRFVQGYDALVLRDFTDEYQKHIEKGVIGGRKVLAGANEAPEEYLRTAGVGKVILNPDETTDGTWEKIGGSDVLVKDVSFPECNITSGSCSMHRVRPELIEINTDVSERADIFVAETYYPAWHYRIDDEIEKHPVLRSDSGFMKIPDIPPGTKKVTLFYDPWFELLGLKLSLVSFVIALGFVIFQERKDVK